MPAYDALIIGGGPAASAAAIRLARLGYSTALVESRPGAFKPGESLPPAAGPLLAELGAMSACEDALPSYGNQSAWGSPVLHETDFILDPRGHGWHVDRPRFERALRGIAAAAGAALMEGTRFIRAERAGSCWDIALDSGRCSARWVVEATGRAAVFARSQGARRRKYDRLVAVVAVLSGGASDRDSRTLVESAPDGWWYTSLIAGGRRVLVFHTDAGAAVLRDARTPGGLLRLARRTQHVHARLEGYRLDGPVRTAPANTARLLPCGGDGWLAAGDAALSFDPLSSQGIATALYSGMQAANAIQAGRDGVPRYRQILDRVFETYARARDESYNCERRWPVENFWARRMITMYNSTGGFTPWPSMHTT